MADLEIAYRLPVGNWQRALFRSNYRYDGGSLVVGDEVVLRADSREQLEHGVDGVLPGSGRRVAMRLRVSNGVPCIEILADGKPAPAEAKLAAPPSRSAWMHAVIALCASAFGLIASWLYLLKAIDLDSPWAMKMGHHMAGWHLLLTVSLFPASVWGQRVGIRSVQFISFVFFCIHAGIALANLGTSDASNPDDLWIALFNALSGVFFLWAVFYGQRAFRDMDPVSALRAGRARV